MPLGRSQFFLVDVGTGQDYQGSGSTICPVFSGGEETAGVLNPEDMRNWRLTPILGDGFSLAAAANTSEQAIKAHTEAAPPARAEGYTYSGGTVCRGEPWNANSDYNDMAHSGGGERDVGSIAAWLLGAALIDDYGDGELRSYSFCWGTPNVSFKFFLGVKCNQLQITGGEDQGDIQFNADWMAKEHYFFEWNDAYTGDPEVGTGAVPARVLTYTTPAVYDTDHIKAPTERYETDNDGYGWFYNRVVTMVDLNDAAGWRRIGLAKNLDVTIANNLEQGAPTAILNTTSLTDTLIAASIEEGSRTISGTFNAQYTTDVTAFDERMLDSNTVKLYFIFRHPNSHIAVCAGTGDKVTNPTGSTFTVALAGDITAKFSAGDFVMLYDAAAGAEQYEIMYCTNVVYSSPVTLLTLDPRAANSPMPGINQTFSTDAGKIYVYSIGMGLRFDNVTITGARDTGDPGSQINLEATFSAGGGLSEAAVYWGVR